MFFVGAFECVVDGKNRLSIPFGIRTRLNPDTDGRSFYVLPGRRQGTLAIYPDKYYEQVRPTVSPQADLSESVHEWWQFECSQTVMLDSDAQGRILIPEKLLKRAGIEKEVTLIGVQDHMELWPREAYEQFVTRNWPEYPAHRAEAIKELSQAAKPAESAAATE